MNIGTENEYIEFIESLSQLEIGIKSLTAMLNRNGCGTVYFGVRDNGEVRGLLVGRNTLNDIRNKVRDLVEPQIIADIRVLKTQDGTDYIELSATGKDIPYSCDGRYYIRNTAADETATQKLLRKMLAAGETDMIREMRSYNQDLTFRELNVFLEYRGIHTGSDDRALRNYGLYNEGGEYNLMAHLLSDQNDFSIKIVQYSGTDKTALSERTEFGGHCLLRSVEQVLDYMKIRNTTRVDVSQGIRKELPLFDYEAFREAWINACLHNSWNERIPPSIYIFDDRIEITSYGGLPYGLSKESFFIGTSRPVNRSLLTVFIAAGFAEQSGHGIPVIVSRYGREAFCFDDGMVNTKISFFYEPDHVTARKFRENRANELSDNESRVYEYLRLHSNTTLQNVADNAGLSLPGVKKIVERLQNENMLVREGSKKKGKWITK